MNKYGLHQRKNGIYEKSVYENGKRIYFYNADPDEVMRQYYAFLDKKEKGYTFSEVARLYEKEHFEGLTNGTVRSYKPALEDVIKWFGDDYIKEISPADINVYIKNCENKYAYKTIKNRKTVLTQVFDHAIVELRIPMYNPCERIKISDKTQQTTREPLTPEQLAEVKSTRPDEFILAFLILYTGTRLGEALALQVKDIDFLDNKISITSGVHFDGNKPYVDRLKTKKSKRIVPLLEPLKIMLKDVIKLYNLKHNEYIIGKESPITLSRLTRQWEKYCREHKMMSKRDRTPTEHNRHTTINKPDIVRHDIRHEYATILYEAGIDVKTAQELLGHADITTTMNIYTHFRDKSLNEATDQLNDYLAD